MSDVLPASLHINHSVFGITPNITEVSHVTVHVSEWECALGSLSGSVPRAGGNPQRRRPLNRSLHLLRRLLLQEVQERAAGQPLDALPAQPKGHNLTHSIVPELIRNEIIFSSVTLLFLSSHFHSHGCLSCLQEIFFFSHVNISLWFAHFSSSSPHQAPVTMTEGLDPVSMLTDDAMVAQWNNEGLPGDKMSTQNATILTNCELWLYYPTEQNILKRRQIKVSVVRSKDIHWGARMKGFVTALLDVFITSTIDTQVTSLLGSR